MEITSTKPLISTLTLEDLNITKADMIMSSPCVFSTYDAFNNRGS